MDGRGSTGAVDFFWLKETVPPGAVPIGEEGYYRGVALYSFIVPAGGDYTVKLFVADSAGVVASASLAFPRSMWPLMRFPRSSPALRSFLIFTTIRCMPLLRVPALFPDSPPFISGGLALTSPFPLLLILTLMPPVLIFMRIRTAISAPLCLTTAGR